MNTTISRTASKPNRTARHAWLCAMLLLGAIVKHSDAQETYFVTNNGASGTGSLSDAVTQADAGSFSVISIQSNLGTISMTSQMFVNANVSILGNGNTIDMSSSDRAFFIAGGTVAISNLTIQNGLARGGDGGDSGGGGAGLGGAIFVANGTSIPGSNVTLGTSVTLSGVTFTNNTAVGGAGSPMYVDASGGGGGMGGAGGSGYDSSGHSGGGGGGFGNGITGATGDAVNGPNGGFVNGGFAGAGGSNDGSDGGRGGNNGGGGGSGASGIIHAPEGGGGGGVNASNADNFGSGGNGGFGGGGGGATANIDSNTGGSGGFGGGGGGGGEVSDNVGNGGNGGFGGGGGGAIGEEGFEPTDASSGTGGFGGGDGALTNLDGADSQAVGGGGGGGAGLGGAVFLMAGASLTVVDSSFSGGTAAGGGVNAGGTGFNAGPGTGAGASLFLGANVTYEVDSGTTAIDPIGGGMADPGDSTDPNAQGGLTKQGDGTLQLTGSNTWTGSTVINQGTLELTPGASENGTVSIVVGENPGDNATLLLDSGVSLTLGGFNGSAGSDAPIVLGQSAGSFGTLTIGSGAGSTGAGIGARAITGGAGGGTINLDQSFAAGGGGDTVYSLFSTITGNILLNQNGPGTTRVDPLYGANTWTGGTVINGGVLAYGVADALPVAGTVTVSGGILDLAGFAGSIGALTLQSGAIVDSIGGGLLSPTSLITQSGTVSAAIGGAGSLVQTTGGTTVLSGSNSYQGGTRIEGGTLVADNTNALGTGSVSISAGTLFVGAGASPANRIYLSGGAYAVQVSGSGSSLAGITNASSAYNDGRDAAATVLAGTSSGATTLLTTFAQNSGAFNDAIRLSAVYSWEGTGSDIFVLQLSMTGIAADSILGGLDTSDNEWENAIDGNTGNNASGGELGFAGSFSAFQSIYGSALASYVGAYGVDTTGAVWAVVDHNSDFAVIAVPEPQTQALLLAGITLGILMAGVRARKGKAKPVVRRKTE